MKQTEKIGNDWYSKHKGEFKRKSKSEKILVSKLSGALYYLDNEDLISLYQYKKDINDYCAEYTPHGSFKTLRETLEFLKNKPYYLYAFKSEIEYMGIVLEPVEDYMFDDI